MKIGIVFAGQGAQYPGMGKDLYDHYPLAKKIFDDAGREIEEWCFEGTKEILAQTHITQPSVYTVTMAAYKAFLEAAERQGVWEHLEVNGLAGFSLGEYAALTAAGSIEKIQDGLTIVTKRGQLMEQAGLDEQDNPRGGMVAAFGKRKNVLDAVKEAKKDRILEGVNFNSPVQTVVAGEREALEDFIEVAKKYKVKAKMLRVSTAFHSEMMIPAAEKLKEVLLEASLKAPEQKVYSNVTARDMMEEFDGGDMGAYIAQRMAVQARHPVYWEETIRTMVEDGAEAIIEVGPGSTLSGLTKKINHDTLTLHVENYESLEHTMNKLKEVIGC